MATPIPPNRAAFTLAEVISATGGTLVSPGNVGENERTDGVSTDTRALGPGALFVALRGETFDAHDHLARAAEAGARAVVIERDVAVPASLAAIKVGSTLDALGLLAREHARRWRALGGVRRTIGITGSAGKTTTRVAVQALLDRLHPGEVHATKGNLNNLVGAPMVLLGLEPRHRYGVIEIGTNRPGEIEALAKMTEPDVGVLTLVAEAHVEELGSIEGVAREKGALLRALPAGGVAIGNGDNDFVRAEVSASRARQKILYGTREDAAVRIVARAPDGMTHSRVCIEIADAPKGAGPEGASKRPGFEGSPPPRSGLGGTAERSEARGGIPSRTLEIVTPLLGEAGALACAAAIAVAEALGDTVSETAANAAFAAAEVGGGAGRLVPMIVGSNVAVIDDSYNANPASMQASIRAAAEIASAERRRLVLVLGEMRELGASAEPAHDEVGRAARASGASLVISVGALANRYTLQLIGSQLTHVHVMNAHDATAFAKMWVTPGDIVLVKGSRGIGTDAVVRALQEHFGSAAQGGAGVRS